MPKKEKKQSASNRSFAGSEVAPNTGKTRKSPRRPKSARKIGKDDAVVPTTSQLEKLVDRIERLEAICAWLTDRQAAVGDISIRKDALTRELSGPTWVTKFPGSSSPEDCIEPFRANLKKFVAAMRAAGASVTISSTLRPAERAWLMHWAWAISKDDKNPSTVPPKAGIDIEWVHRKGNAVDPVTSKNAAAAMVAAYGMKQQAALTSRHIEGRAVDMTISWTGELNIVNAAGVKLKIKSTPRDGLNTELQACGESYGVIKIAPEAHDPPHWSDDGH